MIVSIADAIKQIDADFGKGSIMRLGDSSKVPIETIPTGALTLDLALGGGMPRGRIVEVFGPESSGKTTLVLQTLANAQQAGLHVAFIDAEHALDPHYAEAIGARPKDFYINQPDYGEQGLEIAHRLVKSGEFGVVAVDSVAALTPKAEIEGEMGQQLMGAQARMMSQAMRKLAGDASRTKTLIVFTNQIRMKVGVIFGSPETTPGGRALPFYASQRIDIRRAATNRTDGEAVSNSVRAKVVKNKIAAPYKEAFFDIEFGRGISRAGCLIDVGVEVGVIRKKGSMLYWDAGKCSWRGRPAAMAILDAELDMADAIEAEIRKATA